MESLYYAKWYTFKALYWYVYTSFIIRNSTVQFNNYNMLDLRIHVLYTNNLLQLVCWMELLLYRLLHVQYKLDLLNKYSWIYGFTFSSAALLPRPSLSNMHTNTYMYSRLVWQRTVDGPIIRLHWYSVDLLLTSQWNVFLIPILLHLKSPPFILLIICRF